MLKNELDQSVDLLLEKKRILDLMNDEYKDYALSKENEIFTFDYPVLQYPEKIKSINLDKEQTINGRLLGIRGQYLIFQDDRAINLRKYRF